MPRSSAREQILDAYEGILIEHGPDSITLEAVAARANVSKGGLLYHFGSKDALLDGLLDRLATWTEQYVATARQAAEGVVHHYLRTSVTELRPENPKFRTTLAVMRLYLQEPKVAAAGLACLEAQRRLLAEHTRDPFVADLVALIGEGLLFRATSGSVTLPPASAERMVDRLVDLIGRADSGRMPQVPTA